MRSRIAYGLHPRTLRRGRRATEGSGFPACFRRADRLASRQSSRGDGRRRVRGFQRVRAFPGAKRFVRALVPVRVLGEGGMGTVYLARQQQPFRREVALKVVKLGMDSRQVLERFESERQALAMMEYPNVARVLDAGTSERGRPYFVMEYVDGVPITQYCDGKALSTRERLQLFIPVCNALQHAHKKGIIHRDMKPSNVLVTEVDGKPTPKVIDFGV